MELRGFDSYPITLGDEMRGERASLGKSLDDVERDLRIKRRMIVAIESCDLEGFPNRSVVAGYVRSYARYLGMDPEDCYHRFCRESGYQSPVTMMARGGGVAGRALPLLPACAVGSEIARSRFAAPPARSRFMAPVSLGAVTSAAALLALMAGLSYGGWALLQDIQRVGFAPVPQAPAVVAEAPLITAPDVEPGTLPLPDPRDYQDGGIFAAVAAPAPLQPLEALRRDGPISAIDPRTAGVFAPGPSPEVKQVAGVDSADDVIRAAALAVANGIGTGGTPGIVGAGVVGAGIVGAGTVGAGVVGAGVVGAGVVGAGVVGAGVVGGGVMEAAFGLAGLAMTPASASEPGLPARRGIALHASEDAWIRIRERDTVIFEGTLIAGQQFELPPRIEAPMLKAGNAGGIFVLVDGVAYGPLGRRGQIARDISLTADNIRGSMPQAASLSLVSAGPADLHQRAEADTARQ